VLQQKPSTQRPETHSAPVTQVPPLLFFGTHTPAEQNASKPPLQSESFTQSGFAQNVPSQPVAQSCCSSDGQLPFPSQNATSVARDDLQSGLVHTTPRPG
jgi:hypothetical protein